MSETLRLLRQEHANMAMLLDLLDHQLARFKAGEEPDFAVVKGIIDYFMSYPDLYHHPKEDLIFRKLVQRDAARAALFGDLEAEHETCSDRLDAFARAVVVSLLEAETPRSFAAQARAFVDHERRHMAREEDERYERVAVAVVTFEDELKHQLHMECSDDVLLGVAEYIIDELDEAGYVRDSLEEMAETLKVDLKTVEAALAIVQSLEPPGIGARNMEECLLLQLRRRGEGDSLAAQSID